MMKYDVFISYRRANCGFYVAKLIQSHLEAKNISTYMDLTELHTGRFDEQLKQALENSTNVVIIIPPHGLDRCTSVDDIFRQEIIYAIERGCHIIPVWLEGFEWPETLLTALDALSREAFEKLQKLEAIKVSVEYFDAMLLRLLHELCDVPALINNTTMAHVDVPLMSSESYFRGHMEDIAQIQSVDMAFHAGFDWLMGEEVGIIHELLKAGAYIRVMINTTKALNSIAKNMAQEGRSYPKHPSTIAAWRKLSMDYPEQIEVRLSDIPLLRRYYSIHMKNPMLDTICVKHYTYGNGKVSDNLQDLMTPDSRYFDLFRKEFEFLWKQANS